MTTVVVRPEPDCSQLVHQLAHQGLAALPCPLVSFSPGRDLPALATLLGALPAGSILVAVSPRAVAFTHHALQNAHQAWPAHCHYVAVGQRTATEWQAVCGQPVQYPVQEDSEGMLALTPFSAVEGTQVVILRGESGRDMMGRTLQSQGAQVHYCEAYRRQWAIEPLVSQVVSWPKDTVTTVVVTSGQQLAYFDQLITLSQQHWLRQCRILVPSKRIQDQATALGFDTITTVDSVANSTLVTTLLRLSKTGLSDD
ncbi:uroporphyrinogen-III synthase [Salinivibrio sp. ES.052]|uniref:uroporphyrinogen-III synthase n=1 Tax=Salinivibrio sp. ES.052 TaxID=1882823 RepID=UPI000928E07C|nr:uroporphyrinogen-III synthase [Salinivibrio sp. ES.052]SIO23549.1 uroporphyrinogen-III synthase [Salinivibrio sp. ES.052]